MKSYSSGMSAQLEFSVAINLSPDVMLLDGRRLGTALSRPGLRGDNVEIESDQAVILVSQAKMK